VTAQPVVHFEIVEQTQGGSVTTSPCFSGSFALPSPVAEEVSAPNEYGFLDPIATDAKGRVSPVGWEVDRVTRAMLSSP